MLLMADLFVHVYVLVADALAAEAVPVPRRPGPPPGCSDAEVLTIAVGRHLLGRPSERAFLAEVGRDWGAYFPVLPRQSEFNRRVRWLWGAFELLRQTLLGAVPADPWQLRETSLNVGLLAQTESLFALANGHIGWRGNLDEGEPHGLPGCYLNGFYEDRPLPYAEPGRLVQLESFQPEKNINQLGFSYPRFLAIQENQQVFSDVGFSVFTGFTVTGRGEPEQVPALRRR